MDPNVFRINIAADLYHELREYCDRAGIAFLDFVEDSLEKATYRDELELLLRDEAEMKKKIASEESAAFKRGFSLGVMAATLALKGSPALSASVTPEEAKEVLYYRPVVGDQRKLFD
jgi:hypothetical protein